ncbi:MAG: hypothetical protein IT365_15790 [Candidatus Hydrogenedentes bacterium]|nr:hypothetical protein [Candidatus Hydrogenedentota bacterium]
MQKAAIGFGVLACLSCAGFLAVIASPHFPVDERQKPSEFRAARESVTFSLLGQVRMSIGDLMWLKTLEYLHNGIIYRMPTEAERSQGAEAHEFTGMGAGAAHVDGPTLVPGKEQDWRGVLGTLNRHIEPWRPGHAQHSDPQELIPWYQVLVRFNPHCVQAYVNGAFFMADFAGEPERARDFLLAGADKNPWSFEIQATLGKLYFERFQDYELARDTLKSATALAQEEKAYLKRHEDAFDEIQEQLLGETYLFLARSYEELGDYDRAVDTAEAGMKAVPGYQLLRVEERIATRKRDGG